MAHDNPTLQGADEPSRFLGISGLQWLVVLPVGLFSLVVLHRVVGGVWFLSPLVLVCGAFWLTHGVRFEPVGANLLGFARRRLAALLRRPQVPRVTVGGRPGTGRSGSAAKPSARKALRYVRTVCSCRSSA